MLSTAILAFALGAKHSLDADHLLAVSNFLSGAKGVRQAARMAFSWAAGHMMTAGLVTLALYFFRDAVLSLLLEKMELAVAVMLIIIGAYGLWSARLIHSHGHSHAGKKHGHPHVHVKSNAGEHAHRHLFGVGIVQGLASNDELLLLLSLSLGLSGLAEMTVGVAFFSLGVIAGMILFSLAIALPVVKANARQFSSLLTLAAGTASIAYGVFLLSGFLG